ncbi:unnamed protein product [Mesocestoides corti]|uniref:Coronin n=2 Tax=Mesocestoides corti TaxID=53468 RepID=A0A158QSA4_MESCO|nr:unnamed protein product [Mesocestoides corti]
MAATLALAHPAFQPQHQTPCSAFLRYANLLWVPAGVEASFEGVPISNSLHYGHLAACSQKYLAVTTGTTGGGSVALLDVQKPGRYESEMYSHSQCHSNSITDLAWGTLNDNILATGSIDKTVKLWRANASETENALPNLNQLTEFLHRDRVVSVVWSPNSRNLLATALYGKKVTIWNVESQKVQSTHICTAGAHSLCWSPTSSSRLAAACRDKHLCVFDADSGAKKPAISMTCHQGSKPWKAVFLDDSTVVTVGFGHEGTKEVAVWDLAMPNRALERSWCSQSSGGVILYHYFTSRHFFLSSRGDNGIHLYKYDSRSLKFAGQFQSPHPHRDICWMQQECLDPRSKEIGRCFRLYLPDSSVVLSTGSRRRNNVSTNHYTQEMSGMYGSTLPTNGRSYRKLRSPLIEPLSIQLPETVTDNDEDSSTNSEASSACDVNVQPLSKKLSSYVNRRLINKSKIPIKERRKRLLKAEKLTNGGIEDTPNDGNRYKPPSFSSSDVQKEHPFNPEVYHNGQLPSVTPNPPPTFPKPRISSTERANHRSRRPWKSWKVIPGLKVVEKQSTRVENGPRCYPLEACEEKFHSGMETQEHDQEDRDLNDEILIVTSAFRGHRNGKICAVTTPTTQVILTNSLPSANATGASHSTEIDDNGEDDEEEYATCSVSDLVAAFEARAAEIAACDTTSICSESPCAPSTPLPHPPAPLNFPPLREPPNLEPAGGPREEEIPRAWNVPKPASFQYASKPPSRVYSTNHKRWSMSHSIGAQMSPALRYMQRSQRTSTLSRPASVSEDESNVIARRSAFIIPISDCRVKAAQSETLVEEAIRKCNTEQSPSGSNNECPAFGSADLQLNNSKLRERIIDVLERDEWNTTLPATIREQLECQPKKSHLRMQDMSDNDTLTKALNFERPKNWSSKPTVNMERPDTSYPMYSSFIEPRNFTNNQEVMSASTTEAFPLIKHPTNYGASATLQSPFDSSRAFFNSTNYAPYLRELESTVRRYFSDYDTDPAEKMAPDTTHVEVEDSGSDTEKTETFVHFAELPAPKKVASKEEVKGRVVELPRLLKTTTTNTTDDASSDCDQSYVGTSTEADSDVLSSTYGVPATK